jgi:hypothetical protein
MFRVRTLFRRHGAPGFPLGEAHVRTIIAGRCLGWRQRLHRWGASRRCARLQRLDALWDAQHEQMWTPTASSYRDFLLQERSAALRLAIYQHLALS